MDVIQLRRQIAALTIYQSVFVPPLGQSFLSALITVSHRASRAMSRAINQDACLRHESQIEALKAYGDWVHALIQQSWNWRDYILYQILYAPNPFADRCAENSWQTAPPPLLNALSQDLKTLEQVAQVGPSLLAHWGDLQGQGQQKAGDHGNQDEMFPDLCDPKVSQMRASPSWPDFIPMLLEHYQNNGAGILSQYKALGWQGDRLIGIEDPDQVRLDELVGYESQKAKLCLNTEALLNGFPALNVLLYGSRGTGKSAMIKALIHDYCDRGLRLIELSKANLIHLSQVVQQVRKAPQKFIFFVDDLSFEADEESYKALKVVLEGNVTARPQNVVVYATSNRRHLIREFFEDRPRPSDADEIHSWDTVQEKLSLSDRFGLSLTFEPANQDLFLKIVFHLAHIYGITLDAADLKFRALQWATQQNGRSGRTARQFITMLQAER